MVKSVNKTESKIVRRLPGRKQQGSKESCGADESPRTRSGFGGKENEGWLIVCFKFKSVQTAVEMEQRLSSWELWQDAHALHITIVLTRLSYARYTNIGHTKLAVSNSWTVRH
ncbi:unnamed protein product [Nesidiocoris tenuis]|uniref:Uncharacterized protein n=1 Tax=Nesidiocoris tenuis TaxID=355587 RepID=A0A6H5G123_9HEMI|nr:unnamed protein product [Nesidiocoris tenuis]